jgi:hypothetical protein
MATEAVVKANAIIVTFDILEFLLGDRSWDGGRSWDGERL